MSTREKSGVFLAYIQRSFAVGFKEVDLNWYTPANEHDIGKCLSSTGNTSSNGGFSVVMLVFGGVPVLASNDRLESRKDRKDKTLWFFPTLSCPKKKKL